MSTNGLVLGEGATRGAAARGTSSDAGPSGPLVWLPAATAAVLAVPLFIYLPLELLDWSSSAAEEGRWLGAAFSTFLALVMVFVGTRWCACFAMAFAEYRRDRRPPVLHHWPRVSILVPAYNEGETIEAALESLLEESYPCYEVIVVDDGSSDDTLALARKFEGRHGNCTVRVHSKPNGGKWSALNLAFQRSTGELVLSVDADSRLAPGSLHQLVARLSDPRVACVAGQVRVRNRVNILTRLEALEYLAGCGLMRTAQSFSGMVLVVPGPIGLFRRSVLEEVFIRYGMAAVPDRPGHVAGPYEGDTFAEDFDLSLTILSLGGRIVYEPGAISHTKAPETAFRLLSQRYRWQRGSIQVLCKLFRRARLSPEMLPPRLIVWLIVTYGLEFSILPVVELFCMASIVYLSMAGKLLPLLGWLLTFMLLSVNAVAFYAAVHKETLKVLLVLPLHDFYHHLLLFSGTVIAFTDEIRGARMRW